MRDTDWTASIVPGREDRDTCLVVAASTLGKASRAGSRRRRQGRRLA
jgi:hypothetical protein